MTKYLSAEVNKGHCARLSVPFATGRAEAAPTLSGMLEGRAVWEDDGPPFLYRNGDASSNPDNGDEIMEARFQRVVNEVWNN